MPDLYEEEVLLDAPLAYWRHGNPSGTTLADASGNSRTGALAGTYTLGMSGPVVGTNDSAILYGGGGASLGTGTWIELTGDLTFEAWVKTTSTDTRVMIAAYDTSVGATPGWAVALNIGGSGKLNFWDMTAAAWGTVTPGTAVNDGAWHHLVVTTSGTVGTFYVDGAAQGTFVCASRSYAASSGFTKQLARNFDSGVPFLGTLDEVAVYGSALSAVRILDHYRAGTLGVRSLAAGTLIIVEGSPADVTGIDWGELDGSPNERFGTDGFEATRKLICNWSDRFELARRFMGKTERVGSRVVYTPPQSYPAFARAHVEDIAIEPFENHPGKPGYTTHEAAYEKAVLTLQYKTGTFDSESGGGGGEDTAPFVTEEVEPFSEFLTLSHQTLFWQSNNTQPLDETEAPQKIIRGFDWVYKRHRISAIPAPFFDLVGTVNKVSVTSRTLGYTFPAECLLYQPPKLSREIMADEVRAWMLTLKFTYRPSGWNKWYKRGTDTPQVIYKLGGAQYKPYTPEPFASLVA